MNNKKTIANWKINTLVTSVTIYLLADLFLNTNMPDPSFTSLDIWITSYIGALPFLKPEQNVYWTIKSHLHYDQEGKCLNAFKTLSDPKILWMAYESIKSTPGNMVKGTDDETLDGLTPEWFETTSKALRKEEYQPRPPRRIYIPKANGKVRPLGISSPRDKIIQQAMRIVMEFVIEPKFLDCSHGFRPGKGCHTALKTVRTWKGTTWFIEGDIKAFFDSIDHHMLEKLINKNFREQSLNSLYWKFVKAGYIEWGKKVKKITPTELGVPQGGIISPLLSNLVLHELDTWIMKEKEGEDKKNLGIKPKRNNPEYERLSRKISKTKAEDKDKTDKMKRGNKELKKLCNQRLKTSRTLPTPEYTRIEYVRYADDWLIAVWGPKKRAQILKDQIHSFLKELKLELSLEKTLITNARAERANFLGVVIKRDASNVSPPSTKKNKWGHRRRIQNGALWITAPLKKITERLKAKKFIEIVNGKWSPAHLKHLIPLPLKELILWFRVILNGFLNFYSFVDNFPKFYRIYWILKECLRKTICRKKDMNKTEFLKCFGESISLKVRRLDGEN